MVKRQRSQKVVAEDRVWLERIQAIKGDHPAWGYRRIWAYHTYRQGYTVNKKRVYRLMKGHRLPAPPDTPQRLPRLLPVGQD